MRTALVALLWGLATGLGLMGLATVAPRQVLPAVRIAACLSPIAVCLALACAAL